MQKIFGTSHFVLTGWERVRFRTATLGVSGAFSPSQNWKIEAPYTCSPLFWGEVWPLKSNYLHRSFFFKVISPVTGLRAVSLSRANFVFCSFGKYQPSYRAEISAITKITFVSTGTRTFIGQKTVMYNEWTYMYVMMISTIIFVCYSTARFTGPSCGLKWSTKMNKLNKSFWSL